MVAGTHAGKCHGRLCRHCVGERLGAAIGLNMLTGLPLLVGALCSALFSAWMLFSKNYQRLEKWIMGFVSLIGLAFVFEIWLADVSWVQTFTGWLTPSFPGGALPVIMGVLGRLSCPTTSSCIQR